MGLRRPTLDDLSLQLTGGQAPVENGKLQLAVAAPDKKVPSRSWARL
jgi:hypothetical protein